MSRFTKTGVAVLLLLLLAVVVLQLWLRDMGFSNNTSPRDRRNAASDIDLAGGPLAAREKAADSNYWAAEVLADIAGRPFESLWNSVNATTNKLERIAEFSFRALTLPAWGPLRSLGNGIELRRGIAPGRRLLGKDWPAWVRELQAGGWALDNLEFKHTQFDAAMNGKPAQSHFYFAARLTRAAPEERAILEGELVVHWVAPASERSSAVGEIDASHLELKTRSGAPFFRPILQATQIPRGRSLFIDPLIVYDLDGDGLSEILLVAENLVYHRTSDGGYEARQLCRFPLDSLTAAVVADFDKDGTPDLLCANARGLFLFQGSGACSFEEPARLVWAASPALENALTITCGDIDGDGDLDVFLGQYRVPHVAQVFRPHYYDANDSWPSHLLLNDGKGNFEDVTGTSGLAPKRWRRVYSASFVDLDGDNHLDLAVVSDFAGLDLYRNDGHGHFSDVTRDWVNEPHAFGMAQTVADFNRDGLPDLLMIGMTSATVDRLEHLGLFRPYSAEDRLRRRAMTTGNRLYLARATGGFEETPLSATIARSGWSWGCSAFDFNNDGFPDVYIANGLETKRFVQDYDREFWLHDIFIGDDMDDVNAARYFMEKFARTRGAGWSYGGYDKNRLFLNQGGETFIDVGHLAGVALEQDCRNVVSDDLDGDGKMDLAVTTFEVWPREKQTLMVYRNLLADSGHWIGFRFHEQGEGRSPVGARVTIHYDGHSAVRQIVTGDSHRSQHSNTLHFGLGDCTKVERVEIRWIDGATASLLEPGVDQYHEISHPAAKSPQGLLH